MGPERLAWRGGSDVLHPDEQTAARLALSIRQLAHEAYQVRTGAVTDAAQIAWLLGRIARLADRLPARPDATLRRWALALHREVEAMAEPVAQG